MAAISIPCPKCQSKLKLKDRSLLGKVGLCPKCEHKFILSQDPTDVDMEVVDPTDEPMEGLHPKWIPDQPAAKVSIEEKQVEPVAPQQPVVEEVEETVETPPDLPTDTQTEDPLAFLQQGSSPAVESSFSDAASDTQQPVYRKKRRGSNTKTLTIIFIILFIAAGGVGYLYLQKSKGNVEQKKKSPRVVVNQNKIAAKSKTVKRPFT